MLVNIHRPQVVEILKLGDKADASHLIRLRDNAFGGGLLDMFVEHDWASWDALVAAVAEYRAKAATETSSSAA